MSLSEKRKLFCYYYLVYGNVYEAAVKAGFPPSTALVDGLQTLEQSGCKLRLQRLQTVTNQPVARLATAGLQRLAFGSINDAVSLILCDEQLSQTAVSSLDLFNISELKKVKGGGIEIKFADRVKAMELLLACDREASDFNNAENLINALSASGDINEA